MARAFESVAPRTPQRTPRPHFSSPTPGPFAPPYPEKSVTHPRHPRPGPAPHALCTRPAPSPRLPHFSPPIRPSPAISTPVLKHTHIRAILVFGRGGLQTRPRDRRAARKPYPQRSKTVGASLVGALRPLWAPCGSEERLPAPVLFCPATGHLCPKSPTPALRNWAEPPTLPATNTTECRRI